MSRGGVIEDVEQLKREVAELKAALQGKAGVNDVNTFTKVQSFSGDQNQAAVIINSAKNNSIRFYRGNNENDYVQLFGHDNNLYLHAQSVPETKLLDSRDIPNYSVTNHDNADLTPGSNINILSRRTWDIVKDKIFLVQARIQNTDTKLSNNTFLLFSAKHNKPYVILSISFYNVNNINDLIIYPSILYSGGIYTMNVYAYPKHDIAGGSAIEVMIVGEYYS